MSEPYQIIAGPLEVYWAPTGESFPSLDTTPPGGNWTLLGADGSRDYGDEGVTIRHMQEISTFRGLGGTGPRKAFRTSEGLEVSFALHDMTLESMALALNGNTVTDTAPGASTVGYRDIDAYRGITVQNVALLLRGTVSPYGASMLAQYQIPVCFLSSSPEPVFVKGDPAGLAMTFTALEDPDASAVSERFGTLLFQHAAATG